MSARNSIRIGLLRLVLVRAGLGAVVLAGTGCDLTMTPNASKNGGGFRGGFLGQDPGPGIDFGSGSVTITIGPSTGSTGTTTPGCMPTNRCM